MKIRKHFYMYHDYWTMLRLLTDEELGKLMRAIFLYETEESYENTAIDSGLNNEESSSDEEENIKAWNRDRRIR